MKLSQVKISNILGIESLEIEPGKITKISGKNGTGKTSVIEAIRAALKGGHEATLLRTGQEKGEIVLVLENGMTVTKTITPDGSTTKLIHPEYGKVAKPMQYVEKLADALSVNPIDFINCKASDRAEFLLGAIPLDLDEKKIGEILAPFASELRATPRPGIHALKALEEIEDKVFSFRTDVNRALKEKNATIEQLSASLPAKMPDGNTKAEINQLTLKLDVLAGEGHAMERVQTEKRDAAILSESEAASKKEKDLLTEKQRKIDEINDWYDQESGKIREAYEDKRREFMAECEKALKEFEAVALPQIEEMKVKITTLREAAEHEQKHLNTKGVVDGMKSAAEKLKAKADQLTAALGALNEYKLSLVKNIPIPNIQITKGEIFRDGVAYERLNTAQQVQIAVALSEMRAKDLGLVCLDGAECLDAETMTALEAELDKAGLQAIMTQVTDQEFKVSSK